MRSVLVLGALLVLGGCASKAHLPSSRRTIPLVLSIQWTPARGYSVFFYEDGGVIFAVSGPDIGGERLTASEREQLSRLLERSSLVTTLATHRNPPPCDRHCGVRIIQGRAHWDFPQMPRDELPQQVLDLMAFADSVYQSRFGEPFFPNGDEGGGVKPNQRMNASHSVVTALAHGGKRRAVGRAGYRER